MLAKFQRTLLTRELVKINFYLSIYYFMAQDC